MCRVGNRLLTADEGALLLISSVNQPAPWMFTLDPPSCLQVSLWLVCFYLSIKLQSSLEEVSSFSLTEPWRTLWVQTESGSLRLLKSGEMTLDQHQFVSKHSMSELGPSHLTQLRGVVWESSRMVILKILMVQCWSVEEAEGQRFKCWSCGGTLEQGSRRESSCRLSAPHYLRLMTGLRWDRSRRET